VKAANTYLFEAQYDLAQEPLSKMSTRTNLSRVIHTGVVDSAICNQHERRDNWAVNGDTTMQHRSQDQTELLKYVGELREALSAFADRYNSLTVTDVDDFTRYQLEEAERGVKAADAYLFEAQYDLGGQAPTS
jgi:hypothetical protein